MKTYLTIILCCLASFIYGQNNTTPNEQEYYDFINSVVNHDNLKTFNLEGTFNYDYMLEMMKSTIFKDSIFSHEDIIFINEQILIGRKFQWIEGKILDAKIINEGEMNNFFGDNVSDGWDKYYKKYKSGFRTYSIPLFSVDKTKCIIYEGWQCGGLCGHGNLNLYLKINGNWKLKGPRIHVDN